jgi:hypothetical protein
LNSIDAMNYNVVFDASRNGSQLAMFAAFPVFIALFGLIGWALTSSSDPTESTKGKFFLAGSALGLAMSLMLLVGHYGEYHQAKKALQAGAYDVVERTVQNFVPMPPDGHSTESFSVDQNHFSYGAGWGSIVFNSEWNRGHIHNGAHVRIAYKGAAILRIETR